MECNHYLGPIKVEQETLHRTTVHLERTVLLMNIRKETLYVVCEILEGNYVPCLY